jgi:hypothetical protein
VLATWCLLLPPLLCPREEWEAEERLWLEVEWEDFFLSECFLSAAIKPAFVSDRAAATHKAKGKRTRCMPSLD